MNRGNRPRPEALLALTNGFQVSQAVHVAAVLGIADLLGDGPKTVEQLASTVGAAPQALDRLLRALSSVGIFAEADGHFVQTEMSEYLRDDVNGSVRAWAIQIGRPYFWRSWGELEASVRTGRSAFKALYGTTAWEYRAQHAEDNAVFNAAMRQQSAGVAAAIVSAYDFSDLSVLVDVAGGEGELLGFILKANPRMRGILFDLPHVVAGAQEVFQRLGVADRAQLIAGDFFETVPPAGDGYLLKNIIHDWDDVPASAILQRCRAAMEKSSRLLLIEQVLKPGNQPDPARFSDLNMLVMLDGRERDEAAYHELFAGAGLSLAGITATASRYSIIEARPL